MFEVFVDVQTKVLLSCNYLIIIIVLLKEYPCLLIRD